MKIFLFFGFLIFFTHSVKKKGFQDSLEAFSFGCSEEGVDEVDRILFHWNKVCSKPEKKRKRKITNLSKVKEKEVKNKEEEEEEEEDQPLSALETLKQKNPTLFVLVGVSLLILVVVVFICLSIVFFRYLIEFIGYFKKKNRKKSKILVYDTEESDSDEEVFFDQSGRKNP